MIDVESHRLALGLVVLLVLPVCLSTPGLATAVPSGSGFAATQETPTNNTTVPHEQPSNVSESGDTEQVAQWLEGSLVDDLEQSSIEISQSEYERGSELLGDEYESRLDQYVDVAGETDTTTDDETAESLRETQNQQEEYAETAQSYEETYEAYEEARASGNETAARMRARELEEQSTRLTELNDSLAREYDTIENLTGRDTSNATDALSNRTREIRTLQETVRTQTLVETELQLSTNRSTVAFDAPAALTGRLTTANGTAISNQTIQIVVYEQQQTVRTDSDGQFEITYRPVTLPVNATQVPVRYVPRGASPFLEAEAAVPVTVQQVTPNVTVQVTPSQAGYGQSVTAAVAVTVDGMPVDGLPVTATLGSTQTSNITTDTGQTILSQRIPASVRAGPVDLRVGPQRDDIAIGPGTDSVPLTVTSTATRLTLESEANAQSLTLRGNLTTTTDLPVTDQPVQLTIGNQTRTVRTTQTGTYRLSIDDVSTITDANTSTVTANARFAGTATNLEESQANTTVQLSVDSAGGEANPGDADGVTSELFGGNSDSVFSDTDPTVAIGIGSLLLLLITGGALWRREDTGETTATPSPTPLTNPQPTSKKTTQSPAQQLLQRAQAALTNGETAAATTTAYAAVRTELEQQLDLAESLTHREFVAVCRQESDTVDTETLAKLAENYEQVTFAGMTAATHAQSAVTAASELLNNADTA